MKLKTANELIELFQKIMMGANFKELDELILEIPVQYVPKYEDMIGQPIENGGLLAYNGIKYMRKTAGTVLAENVPDVTPTQYRVYRDSGVYEWIAQEYILNGYIRYEVVDGVQINYKYIGESGSNNNGRPSLNPKTWEKQEIV